MILDFRIRSKHVMSKNNSYNYFKERKYRGAENYFTFYVTNMEHLN
jgi:hypothetical protein